MLYDGLRYLVLGTGCGRSSLVVKVMDLWPTCREFELVPLKMHHGESYHAPLGGRAPQFEKPYVTFNKRPASMEVITLSFNRLDFG
ncbi:hypothetical protein TNCV_4601751 [Trichonephila clavipes]|nr:hypothetical protein TNCV_4601751 [Trichonephila clavipes]